MLHQQVSNAKICEDPTSTRQLLLLGSAVERRWWRRSPQRCCETSWSVRTKTYIQELSLRQTAWYVHKSVCSLLLHIAKRLIDSLRSATQRRPRRNVKKNIKIFAHRIKNLDLLNILVVRLKPRDVFLKVETEKRHHVATSWQVVQRT